MKATDIGMSGLAPHQDEVATKRARIVHRNEIPGHGLVVHRHAAAWYYVAGVHIGTIDGSAWALNNARRGLQHQVLKRRVPDSRTDLDLAAAEHPARGMGSRAPSPPGRGNDRERAGMYGRRRGHPHGKQGRTRDRITHGVCGQLTLRGDAGSGAREFDRAHGGHSAAGRCWRPCYLNKATRRAVGSIWPLVLPARAQTEDQRDAADY